MLQKLVDWSLRRRVVVVFLAALLLGAGLQATQRARLDVFPEFTPPRVTIQTEAPGLSPLEVEQLVTLPIEQAVSGLPRLQLLRSNSIQGLSVVTVIFQDGTDIYQARPQVSERLGDLVRRLPRGVQAPRLAPLMSTTGRLLTVGFTSDQLTPMQLRDRLEWNLRPRLLAVRGVAQVTIYGGAVRQFQIEVHPEALAARSLTLNDVLEAARLASDIRGAGFLENANQRLTLRTEGQVYTVGQLAEAVITTVAGTPVRLGDVASVREGPEPKYGDAAVNGQPGVVLITYRQLDGDTLEVTQALETELGHWLPGLEREGIRCHLGLFRQANFIEQAIGNVTEALLLGAGLVMLVLVVFLWNWRTAFISMTAIPLSLLGAVAILWAWGLSLNTLTLGGLAIAVGEVVDDAIIDVENIFRRLRENRRQDQPRSALAVVLTASLEVRSAVVYATFVVVLVFTPVFFLSGLQGRLFAPLGYAYCLAVLVSLLVALTVTPALSLLLLPRASGTEEPPLLRRLQGGYEALLRRLDGIFPLVLTATLLLVAAAGWTLFHFGGEFLPELRENHLVVHMRGLPGTSLEQSMTTGRQVARKLLEHPGIRSVAQQAGRAELSEDTWGVEYSELEVAWHRPDAANLATVEEHVKKTLQGFAGFSFEVFPFLTERIKETLSGQTAEVVVKVLGDDLATIDGVAQDIARLLNDIPGHANVRVQAQAGGPELVIRLRPEAAARYGLRNVQILDAINAAYQGVEVGQVYERNRIIDVVVRLDRSTRGNPALVGDLWLAVPGSAAAAAEGGPAGERPAGRLQLKQVADVFLAEGRFLIAHEAGLRSQVVTCNVTGRDVESFVTEAERRVRQMSWPAGVDIDFTGEHVAKRTTQRELLLLSLAAGAGIVILLGLAFGSVRALLLVLANLPFALVGGVAAVFLTGGVLDVGSLIGFVTLFGISVRNSIMMVAHWQQLQEEGWPWGAELVFRGARERLAPVLMTALVTGLGLLPIALGSALAGREIEGPMAQVILGGLATSTALNLIVLPVLYRRWGLEARGQRPGARGQGPGKCCGF